MSVRKDLVLDYLYKVDLVSFFVGVDRFSIDSIYSLGGNPHNGYVLGHSSYGFLYFLIISYVLFMGLFFAFNRYDLLIYLIVILIFMMRNAFDILSLFGLFDYVFYYIFFVMVNEFKYAKRL